jgi:hypothetical protein
MLEQWGGFDGMVLFGTDLSKNSDILIFDPP